MPINRPTADELETAIEQYRANPDNDPKVDGYYRKIIEHLDALLEREEELGKAFAKGEQARLVSTAELLSLPDASLQRLCERFAEGNLMKSLPIIIEIWLPLAKEKLKIDNPRYRE